MLVNLLCFAGGTVFGGAAVWAFVLLATADDLDQDAKRANDQRAAIYRSIYDQKRTTL